MHDLGDPEHTTSTSPLSPAHHPLGAIKPAPELPIRLDHLALQDRVLDEVLAVLRSDPAPGHAVDPERVRPPVHYHVGAVLVPADVVDEVDADAAGPLVVEVAEQPQRPEMPLELLAYERRALRAPRVSRLVRAQQN